MEKKICSRCGVEKEVCEFYKTSKTPTLYRCQCKKCMNKHSTLHYINNKDKILKQSKEYASKNSEKIKAKQQEIFSSSLKKHHLILNNQ